MSKTHPSINISKVYFDGFKTHGFVKTSEFSEWMWVSGRLSEDQFAAWTLPAVQARLAELALPCPAGADSDDHSPCCG